MIIKRVLIFKWNTKSKNNQFMTVKAWVEFYQDKTFLIQIHVCVTIEACKKEGRPKCPLLELVTLIVF